MKEKINTYCERCITFMLKFKKEILIIFLIYSCTYLFKGAVTQYNFPSDFFFQHALRQILYRVNTKIESKYFKISWCLISIGKCDDNRIVKAVKEIENCIKIK